MEIRKLAEQMQKIKKVYGDKMELDNDIIGIWFEQFKGCRDDWFMESVKQHIASSQFAPLPANIWEQYHKIEDDDKKKHLELWKQYNSLCSNYPGGARATKECENEFYRIADGNIDKAKMVVERAETVVKAIESGEGYIPLLEYLKGL